MGKARCHDAREQSKSARQETEEGIVADRFQLPPCTLSGLRDQRRPGSNGPR